jgi:hypothetical protein
MGCFRGDLFPAVDRKWLRRRRKKEKKKTEL